MEWPELGSNSDNSDVKSASKSVSQKALKVNLNVMKPESANNQPLVKQLPKVSQQTSPSVSQKTNSNIAWGGAGVEKPSNAFTLLDAMSEDMKKMCLNKQQTNKNESDSSLHSSPPIQHTYANQTKAWNIQETSSSKINSPNLSSFAQIIEMEKKTKEKYEKLKAVQLSSIQLEEKAIEELKKLYDVENNTKESIKIELIDENEFKNCAPLWKKK
jgi:hypothetical protein